MLMHVFLNGANTATGESIKRQLYHYSKIAEAYIYMSTCGLHHNLGGQECAHGGTDTRTACARSIAVATCITMRYSISMLCSC